MRTNKPAAKASNPWQEAVDQALVTAYLGIATDDVTREEAVRQLNELIDWHVQVATDPAVNGGFSLQPLPKSNRRAKMTNDELKALYEKCPWAWDVWYTWGNRWFPIDEPSWLRAPCMYRLKPKLPADLPEPTEDMMNRAVYLGKHVVLPEGVRCLRAWRPVSQSREDWTFCESIVDPSAERPYCIDINDPNADEIIALNRTEIEGPEYNNGEVWCPHAEPGSSEYARKCYVREGLIEFVERIWPDLKVVPKDEEPGESKWLRLDECDWEIHDGCGWQSANVLDVISALASNTGPASVRVRKKQ